MMQSLSDTTTWLPLEGLEPGFDASKPAPVGDLAGREIVVAIPGGTRISHRFGDTTVDWEYLPGDGDPTPAATGSDPVEVFRIAEDLYLAQFHHEELPDEAVSLVLDLCSGWALAGLSVLGSTAPGMTAVQHRFAVGAVDGLPQHGGAPEETLALIGRRVEWVYSLEHAYEHIYLSPHWYTWHCLAGPERGLADTDEVSMWQLRPGIYVFAWREKVVPCGSITVADHRDPTAIRSVGVLFGRNSDGGHSHFTFGASGRLVSITSHAPQLDPARSDRS